MSIQYTLTQLEARRLALVRAGLLKPEWTSFPTKAKGAGRRARKACHTAIDRFGYLQLDTISIAGSRSHGVFLLSRLEGLDPALPEELLQPGEPLFEYWGHEASWIPIELYPVFAFRRKEYKKHPWYGDIIGENRALARKILRRIREEGPLRSADFEGTRHDYMWGLKLSNKLLGALWSCGDLAIRERHKFGRIYDLTERVIPSEWREKAVPTREAIKILLLKALDGHGWAPTRTLTATWRLQNRQKETKRALADLHGEGRIYPCSLELPTGRKLAGWIRPADLEPVSRLRRIRPRADRGVLLTPFDPLLWDRQRVQHLFGFDQVLEIYKPAPKRIYGYYCLPVLAGDHLVARCDLKADRRAGILNVLSVHYEDETSAEDREATRIAMARYSRALQLKMSISSVPF
jgi:uncharacterized protein YcaQ